MKRINDQKVEELEQEERAGENTEERVTQKKRENKGGGLA